VEIGNAVILPFVLHVYAIYARLAQIYGTLSTFSRSELFLSV